MAIRNLPPNNTAVMVGFHQTPINMDDQVRQACRP
jgi:hypothetical protein